MERRGYRQESTEGARVVEAVGNTALNLVRNTAGLAAKVTLEVAKTAAVGPVKGAEEALQIADGFQGLDIPLPFTQPRPPQQNTQKPPKFEIGGDFFKDW